jgi:hypothetical protein
MVKKLRVVVAWTLDLLFGRDIEQMITLRDVEELSERWTRIRAQTQNRLSATPDAASFPQPKSAVGLGERIK